MNERYIKNIDEIFTEDLQQNLLTKTISIIGCGSRGGFIAEYLARLGISAMYLWDGGEYERSNLNRSIGCLENNIGENKAFSIKKRIQQINSSIHVEYFPRYFGEQEQEDFEMLNKSDIIFLCFNNSQNVFKIRQIIRYVITLGTPAIDCSYNLLGGFISINTNKDLSHFDSYTQKLCNQKIYDLPGSGYKSALIAAEAVNAMVQYFNQENFTPVNSKLDIDIYHHKYIKSDKYGFI